MGSVTPMLNYEDGPAAMGWLAKAFGFKEITRMMGDDGLLAHGEMDTGAGVVMLATATPDYESPKTLRENYEKARVWSSVPWVIDGVLIYVDNVDAHCERARKSGATILTEPEEGFPGKRYRVEDIEGHRWMFMQRDTAEDEVVKDELEKLGKEWAEAMVANDADRIGSVMANEWVIVSERGISTKDQFLGYVRSGALTHSMFEMVGDARVRSYGDMAVFTCRVVNTAHFGGQTFEADEWTSDVFVKRDGRWLCVLSHITPVDKEFEKMTKEKQQ